MPEEDGEMRPPLLLHEKHTGQGMTCNLVRTIQCLDSWQNDMGFDMNRMSLSVVVMEHF